MLSHFVGRYWKGIAVATIVAASAGMLTTDLPAQGGGDTSSRGRMGGGQGGRGGDRDRPNQGPSKAMIAEWQRTYERVLRNQVTLSDDQIVKWRSWNTRFDAQRRATFAEENDIRRTLRVQLARGATPDEGKVTDAMDRWTKLQRQRLDLKEKENRELATFLTPIQRARLFALQDEAERMFREADNRRGGRGDGPGGRGGPPFGSDSGKFRQGMRGDTAGGKFTRGAAQMRPPGKVDTMPLVQKPKGN
ncbi:MAG: hypothetical protein ABJB74_08620 [Gemmatimonas sp.]